MHNTPDSYENKLNNMEISFVIKELEKKVFGGKGILKNLKFFLAYCQFLTLIGFTFNRVRALTGNSPNPI